MKIDREGRRTVAQFLNGLAVALVATLVLAPLTSEQPPGIVAVGAVLGAVLLHVFALLISS